MRPTLTNPKASNWVDRGESPHATIERVLARFLDRNVAEDPAWFRGESETIVGMVAADATEVHIAGYLRTILSSDVERDSSDIRLVAIAVWHIAKAALVRDFAERVLQGDIPPNDPTRGVSRSLARGAPSEMNCARIPERHPGVSLRRIDLNHR